jgi:hypothetical protein
MDEEETVNPEYVIDFDNLPPTKHNWVVRGDIISCEGAGHPCHQHYIKRVVTEPTE